MKDKSTTGKSAEIDNLLQRNLPFVEQQVLGMCIFSQSFYQRIRNHVFHYIPAMGVWSNDFSVNIYNSVFHTLIAYWESATVSGIKSSRVPMGFILNCLQFKVTTGELSQGDVSQVAMELSNRWVESNFPPHLISALADSPIYTRWIDLKRAQKLTQRLATLNQSGQLVYMEEVMGLVETFTKMQPGDAEDLMVDVGELIDSEQAPHAGIRMQFRPLHQALGGLLHLGHSTLIGACKGGGKTVMATQMQVEMVKVGMESLLITTEQPPRELLYRVLSNVCNIDFSMFTMSNEGQGVTGLVSEPGGSVIPQSVRNNPRLMELIQQNKQLIKGKAFQADWSKAPKNISASLRIELEKVGEKLGSIPKLLIFDWVGGALGKDTEVPLRLRYNETTEELTHVAKEFDIHTMAFCQLDITKALNKHWVGMEMVSESKSMTDPVSNFLGITSIRKKDFPEGNSKTMPNSGSVMSIGGEAEGHAVWDNKQFLCADKSRMGAATTCPIHREFKFQRFAGGGESSPGARASLPTVKAPALVDMSKYTEEDE